MISRNTRPAGVTTLRTITTQTTDPHLADDGAIVAWIFDPMTATPPMTFTRTVILEH